MPPSLYINKAGIKLHVNIADLRNKSGLLATSRLELQGNYE